MTEQQIPQAAIGLFVVAVSNMLVRHVKVNRDLTPRQALEATGRRLYVSNDVVAGMPRGEGEETDVFFFKPDSSAYNKKDYMSDDELDRQYELRGLKRDPYAEAAVNKDDPAFSDEHPNGCNWKDADGNWCFATFSWRFGGRDVSVNRSARDWPDDWWFAGVRK